MKTLQEPWISRLGTGITSERILLWTCWSIDAGAYPALLIDMLGVLMGRGYLSGGRPFPIFRMNGLVLMLTFHQDTTNSIYRASRVH